MQAAAAGQDLPARVLLQDPRPVPIVRGQALGSERGLLAEDLLEDVGHAQWVFVIPKMLRPYSLRHRGLLGGLARAAWGRALELMQAATDDQGLRPGMVAVVQTAGDLANWHPHVHALVSRGGWTRGWEWVPVPYVDEHAAELLFRHKVLRLLQEDGLLSEERTELLLSWRHTGFSVHTRVRVEPEDRAAVERLARSILRPPISLDRMQWDGEGEVRYRRKAGHESSGFRGAAEEAFDPADFLARVLMHVPEPRRHLVRYYGAYSNASRGRRRRELERDASSQPSAEGAQPAPPCLPDERRLRRRWSRLIKRVSEVDPLVCPSCGGEMRVVAFILDHQVVDKILRHLERRGEQRERAPPEEPTLEAAS